LCRSRYGTGQHSRKGKTLALGTVQQVVAAGLNPTYATPNSSENITPNDRMFLHVKNASGAAITVTLTDPGYTPAGSVATNPSVSVPAAGERMIPLNTNLTNTTTGFMVVAFSATASVTVALIRN
jgi:hypothetical protein